MSYVFEARLMPFEKISEEVATSIAHFFGSLDSELYMQFSKMSLWDRCMLASVLPVVRQRRQEEDKQCQRNIPTTERSDSELKVVNVSRDELEVALKIIGALDQLTVAAESIRSSWANGDEIYGPDFSSEDDTTHIKRARQGRRDGRTTNKIVMKDLLREALRDTSPWISSSSNDDSISNDPNNSKDHLEATQRGRDREVDIAMCFNLSGDSVGIGNASLFGGHGYHPR